MKELAGFYTTDAISLYPLSGEVAVCKVNPSELDPFDKPVIVPFNQQFANWLKTYNNAIIIPSLWQFDQLEFTRADLSKLVELDQLCIMLHNNLPATGDQQNTNDIHDNKTFIRHLSSITAIRAYQGQKLLKANHGIGIFQTLVRATAYDRYRADTIIKSLTTIPEVQKKRENEILNLMIKLSSYPLIDALHNHISKNMPPVQEFFSMFNPLSKTSLQQLKKFTGYSEKDWKEKEPEIFKNIMACRQAAEVLCYEAPAGYKFTKIPAGSKYQTNELNIYQLIIDNPDLKYIEHLETSSLNYEPYGLFLEPLSLPF